MSFPGGHMKKPLRKAVFPVAGLGSRFLPATKANPKEMLPIVDKPLIQYAVEEAIKAGFTEMIFVTSSSKRAIEDHFDKNFELEARLQQQDKQALLNVAQNILPKGINCIYVRQAEPLGLGDAVLCAKNVIGDEAFAVLLADDLLDNDDALCLEQMVTLYHQNHENIIAVESIPLDLTEKYGVVAVSDHAKDTNKILDIIEKPKPKDAPSNLGVAGRYILQPEIFDYLEKQSQGLSNEIQLTDAISQLIKEQSIYAYKFKGKRYDCGSKLGYLKATVACALKHPELAQSFKSFLSTI